MMKMIDTRCPRCDKMFIDVYDDERPRCCGKETKWTPTQVNTPEWGGPRQYIHLRDQPFDSRSELDSWTKAQGLEQAPSADKHGGARNEDHINLGKKYSYKGAPAS